MVTAVNEVAAMIATEVSWLMRMFCSPLESAFHEYAEANDRG
jgi:hypothetical protein